MEKTFFRVSSYYNEYEDQGMRECVCGVVAEGCTYQDVFKHLVDGLMSFMEEFDLSKGKFTYNCSDLGMYNFIDWHEEGNDRCFGFEIEELKV